MLGRQQTHFRLPNIIQQGALPCSVGTLDTLVPQERGLGGGGGRTGANPEPIHSRKFDPQKKVEFTKGPGNLGRIQHRYMLFFVTPVPPISRPLAGVHDDLALTYKDGCDALGMAPTLLCSHGEDRAQNTSRICSGSTCGKRKGKCTCDFLRINCWACEPACRMTFIPAAVGIRLCR